MPTRLRPRLTLVILLLLAAAVAWSLPGQAGARALFQSPPEDESTFDSSLPTDTPTATATATITPVRTAPPARTVTPPAGASPTPAARATVAPTLVPGLLPTAVPTPVATVAVAGYLPPPTLTAPGAFLAGRGLLSANPAAAVGSEEPGLAPAQRGPAMSEQARLIDAALLAFAYTWLVFGALALLAALGLAAWLLRAGRPE